MNWAAAVQLSCVCASWDIRTWIWLKFPQSHTFIGETLHPLSPPLCSVKASDTHLQRETEHLFYYMNVMSVAWTWNSAHVRKSSPSSFCHIFRGWPGSEWCGLSRRKQGCAGGHCAPYSVLAVCSNKKSFFRKHTRFGTWSQSFKLSFGCGICGIGNCQWQHFHPWQVIFDFQHFNLTEILGTYFFPLKKKFIWLRKWPLADVFLLVLSQFRLSHIRPLGAIYSLPGFCMCSVQTFLTVGHLIIMDKYHSSYGT